MVEIIPPCLVVWVGIGILLMFVINPEIDDKNNFLVVFWPLTLVILLVFGFFYAIFRTIALGIGMFRY